MNSDWRSLLPNSSPSASFKYGPGRLLIADLAHSPAFVPAFTASVFLTAAWVPFSRLVIWLLIVARTR
jgi:hypothetical protein